MSKPPVLVWLPADNRVLGSDDPLKSFLVLGEKYARAVKDSAGAQPVVFALAEAADIDSILAMVDGVMLTGSPSNVHPSNFNEPVANPALPLDPKRDALTLQLVRECVDRGVPLLGVCRGFQEINVALGGSLHQAVQNVPGFSDHREDESLSLSAQYSPSHAIEITPDSAMAVWAGGLSAKVNSLHGQGIARLAQGLRAIAHAPDGLVEAFEVSDAKAFAYAVQWHPEWKTPENPFYSALFAAFGEACKARHTGRTANGGVAA